MAQLAVDERHALAETLRSVEPDSPTLCGDWSAAQLAAHLVLRERSVIEGAGRLPVRALQRSAARHLDAFVGKTPYPKLVDAVDNGPAWRDLVGPVPIAWIWSIPAVREQANLLEYLVHHEDVRRARPQWQPRQLPEAVQRAVWTKLPGLTRLTMRGAPVGVALRSPEHGEFRTGRAKRAGVAVTVTGKPLELALFAFGRQSVAQVDYDGAPGDVATVRGARMGI